MSDPAADTIADASLVITTSSVELHVPFVIVHRSVALVPAANPVTMVVGELAVVIVAVPDIKLHNPVPVTGVFAAIVKLEVLH